MGGISLPHRDSIPDHPASSQSLYRLSYPSHQFTRRTQKFSLVLDSVIVTFFATEYRNTVHVIFLHLFSQKNENFHFSQNTWCLPTDGILVPHFLFVSERVLQIFVSERFNAHFGAPFSSAQGVFRPTVQHDLLMHFNLFGKVSIWSEPLFVLQHLFWCRRLACCACFQDILCSY